jgi:phospholipid N-methyltransferase
MSAPKQAIRFALNFFRYPYMLGSIVPSSRFLVDDVMARVDWEKAKVVVEYGPGVGTITQEVLKRMRPDARLIAIELNPNFFRVLEKEIQDSRFKVVHGSALDVRQVLTQLNLPNADYIISGIPFSTMQASLRRGIAQEARQALHPDGALVVYQFSRVALPYLESNFTSVRKAFQPWNILPAHIYYCTP